MEVGTLININEQLLKGIFIIAVHVTFSLLIQNFIVKGNFCRDIFRRAKTLVTGCEAFNLEHRLLPQLRPGRATQRYAQSRVFAGFVVQSALPV
jgi:hypothetical protein